MASRRRCDSSSSSSTWDVRPDIMTHVMRQDHTQAFSS